MKKSEIVVGKVYAVKVSGQLAPVRILYPVNISAHGTRAAHASGIVRHIGKWIGVNEKTGRQIGPFTAAKCRWEIVEVQPGCYRVASDVEGD